MLLADISTVFANAYTDRIFSRTLVEALLASSERPWGEARKGRAISENWLARKLKTFDIAPKTVRIGDDTAKGYYRKDFDDAFARFLVDTPDWNRHTVTKTENIGSASHSDMSQAEGSLRIVSPKRSNAGAGCDAVTVSEPQSIELIEELL